MTASKSDTPSRAPSGPERPFFFVHVMKTGGTSLVKDILKTFPPEHVYPNKTLDRSHPADIEPYTRISNLLDISPERRADIWLYAGHFPYMACDMMGIDFVKLTLLRHPVDRAISVLKQFKRLVERFHASSLEEIYDDFFVFPHWIQNHQTKIFSLTPEDKPTWGESPGSFLPPLEADARRLADAKANLAQVDVVGLSERYNAFTRELHDRFGWWPTGLEKPARSNVSGEGWKAGDALREQIALDNALDLEFYDFARQLVEDRRRSSHDAT